MPEPIPVSSGGLEEQGPGRLEQPPHHAVADEGVVVGAEQPLELVTDRWCSGVPLIHRDPAGMLDHALLELEALGRVLLAFALVEPLPITGIARQPQGCTSRWEAKVLDVL